MKDEGYVITQLRRVGVETKSQDGYQEYLLCQECEAYLGEAGGELPSTTLPWRGKGPVCHRGRIDARAGPKRRGPSPGDACAIGYRSQEPLVGIAWPPADSIAQGH